MSSTARRSSESCLEDRAPRPAPPSGRARPAFTLIELLVVVAIIALLLAILLPSLGCAREQARAAVCGSQLRSLGTGLSGYASEFDDWIPGMNTSGVAIRALIGGPPEALRRPSLPVQPHDWMTPLLRHDTQLPASRAQRFYLLINKYKCRSQVAVTSQQFQGGNVPDLNEFQALPEWTGLSYLMPVYFQYWGQKEKGRILARNIRVPTLPVRAEAAPPNWEVVVDSFVSRIGRLGAPATKVFAADGTRYLTAQGVLDHDISPWPSSFGSFTAGSAWWSADTAYGVESQSHNWNGRSVPRGSPSGGQNLRLSYRHSCSKSRINVQARSNKGKVNAAFFDGHVDRLSDQESRKPELWYPAGAVVQTPQEGMTDVPAGYVIR